MPYVENRIVHDADSHLMELPDCLDAYFDPPMRRALPRPALFQHKQGAPAGPSRPARGNEDPAFRAGAEANILLRKN